MIERIKRSVEDHTKFGNFITKSHEFVSLANFFINPLNLKSIHLQFVNYCNLNCEYCSFGSNKNKENIDEKLLRKLFDEILFKEKKFQVRELNLWVAGENLLHPRIFEIFDLLAEYKKKSSKFPKVRLYTNVMVLTESFSKKLIDMNILDSVGFSVDGGSKEECEKIRRGSKFDTIKKNIENFQKYNKGKISTMVNCLIPIGKPLSPEWMSDEFKEMLDLVDYYKLNYPMDVGVKVEYPKGFHFYNWGGRICRALNQSIAIIHNGDVLPCCGDFNGVCVLGNLYKYTLAEICRGKSRKTMVNCLLNRKKDKIPLCKNCNRFSIPYKVFRKRSTK